MTTLAPARTAPRSSARAGAVRRLPNRRFHELFAEQAAREPHRTAVRCGERSLTYGELHADAGRVAATLLDAGLRAEDIVAVVMPRGLPWAAAVIGTLRAGGVYLPVDPDYPADRIATLLARSGCRLVLDTGDCRALDAALTDERLRGVRRIGTVRTGRARAADPPVHANQLAYIYFTSGSTGEPKGAMCEHAGMLNHLLAKVEVLGLCRDDVVVQSAPQCFDISLWQLAAPLLVGAQSLIVGPEIVRDVTRFRAHLRDATVLQVVPSYLDLLLRDLERAEGSLGRVRCVSVTGEAIAPRLAARWFRRFPHIPLVNAYGATEVSDDTTHAVLRAVPGEGPVTVGRPIPNVEVDVVDERLRPVPSGTPGEVVFSGVCVGRGYVNDPVRTCEAFVADPRGGGRLLYRTGDVGRWRDDGSLEFLGRRDDQIKIRGMRVELGEVENRLLALPDVRAGTVLAHRTPTGTSLVAFYVADGLPPDRVLAALSDVLPGHMVPARCLPVDSVPVTENGKTDRAALLALLREAEPAARREPTTELERRIAAAWADVLGRPVGQIGLDDHFFRSGGDSLAALRLIVSLDGLVTLADLLEHPVLAELTAVAAAR